MTLCSSIALGQPSSSCTNGGPQTGRYGQGGDDNSSYTLQNFKEWFVRVIVPKDPNEMLGPVGYDTVKWVSIKDRLNYTVRFENDPKLATAPAQNVFIRIPVHPNINVNSLQLSDFGFGKFRFAIPPGSSFYSERLDVRDSIGLFVDLTTGIDVINNEIFWRFRSIDPTTGLPPTDPLMGFLPVNDTAKNENDTIPGKGEGFVSFTIKAADAVQTRDTVSEKALIVFDTEEPILTNTWKNTIDAVAPTSKVHAAALSRDTITLRWSGADDANGSGLKEYDVYYAENNGRFALYQQHISDTTLRFIGTPGQTYKFFTRAADNTGNMESSKDSADITVRLGGCLAEICNEVDDDCDGLVDEGFIVSYYRDADGDGFGSDQDSVVGNQCVLPAGYAYKNGDCNDNDSTIYPGSGGYGCEVCATEAITFAARTSATTSCQWQVDSGGGYQPIVANDVYSGTTSAYLTLTSAPTRWTGYKLRCAITNGNAVTYSPEYTLRFAAVWNGTVSNAWENTANWGCGKLPDEYTDVIVPTAAPLRLNGDAAIRHITLAPVANVTIKAGSNLEVKGK